jgi:hypothetical protein
MCICPKKAILPSGTLMPNSSNLSTKTIQSKQLKTNLGLTFYNNNVISFDILIGTIQYIKKITFYYKSSPVPFHNIQFTEYGSTYDESIQNAAIYLTLLSNKKIPNSILFPFYKKDNLVYALGFQKGNIIQYTINPCDSYYYAYYKNA